jgi:hypothetical protein
VDVGWEADTDETIKQVEVEIHYEPTRHIVNVPKLLNWVKQDTSRPGQQTRKEKLREEIAGDAIEEAFILERIDKRWPLSESPQK